MHHFDAMQSSSLILEIAVTAVLQYSPKTVLLALTYCEALGYCCGRRKIMSN